MTYCEPHLERTGQKVLAAGTIGDPPTWMCQRCLRGFPIKVEETMGYPEPRNEYWRQRYHLRKLRVEQGREA